VCLVAVLSLMSLCGAMAQSRYDQWFLEAMRHREQGHATTAFEMLRHCVELRPEAAEAHFYLGQYYAQMKQDSTAMACFRRAAELRPDNDYYQEVVAEMLEAQKNYGEATAAYEALYAKHKERVDVLQRLAQLYHDSGELEKSVDALDRLENSEGKSEEITYAKCAIYTELGRREAAVKEMEDLSARYPNDLSYKASLADMLLLNDQTERATQMLRDVLAEEPTNNHARLSLQAYYADCGDSLRADSLATEILMSREADFQEKLTLLRRIIYNNERKGGDSTQVLNLFRRVLSRADAEQDIAEGYAAYTELKKMPQDSIESAWQMVFDRWPDSGVAAVKLISYAWERQDGKRVIDLCQTARQYHPEELAFYYYQGIAYFQDDREQEALSALRSGVSLASEETNTELMSDSYALMGDLLHEQGKAEEAFAAYDSCLVWNADNVGCLNNYAYYLSLERRDLDKAERMSLKTVRKEPENATYLDTYAWILFEQERYAEAKIYIEQAVERDTAHSAVITEHAGDICAMNGDTEKALQYWQEALKKSPDNRLLARKIKRKKYIKQ